MPRLHFESPNYVDPTDSTTEELRRHRIPLLKLFAAGFVALVAIAGLAYTQLVVFAEEPLPTLAEYQARAQSEGKHLVLVFPPANRQMRGKLLSRTLEDEKVQSVIDESFVILRLEREMPKYTQHMATYQVRRTPTIVVTAADGSILRNESGEPVRHAGNIGPMTLIGLLTDENIQVGPDSSKEVPTSTRRLTQVDG
jgi:hypothetical protein